MKKVIVSSDSVIELTVNFSKCHVVESVYHRGAPSLVWRRTVYPESRAELYHSFYFDTPNDFLKYVHDEGFDVRYEDYTLSRPRYFGKNGRRLSAYYRL